MKYFGSLSSLQLSFFLTLVLLLILSLFGAGTRSESVMLN